VVDLDGVEAFAEQQMQAVQPYVFTADHLGDGTKDPLLMALDRAHPRVGYKQPWVTTLPDAWYSFSRDFEKTIRGTNTYAREGAPVDIFLEALNRWLPDAIQDEADHRSNPALMFEPSPIEQLVQSGQIRVLKISGATYNPRYRGRLLTDARAVLESICHLVLALRCSAKGTGGHG
jgi:hypothetical protein